MHGRIAHAIQLLNPSSELLSPVQRSHYSAYTVPVDSTARGCVTNTKDSRSPIGLDMTTSSKIRTNANPVLLHEICLYLNLTVCRERPCVCNLLVTPPNSSLFDRAALDRSNVDGPTREYEHCGYRSFICSSRSTVSDRPKVVVENVTMTTHCTTSVHL
jgi:hypothetical protein